MENYLKKLSNSIGNKLIHRTHQQIADDLNVSREAVSRLLKKLEKMEIVKLGRNEILYLEN